MSFRLNMRFAPVALLLAACGAAPEEEAFLEGDVAEESEAIVRGEPDDGHAAVVAVDVFKTDGSETFCTGVLYAKKVVMTAAHCIDGAEAAMIYTGSDFYGDMAELENDPATWVKYRLVFEFETHPKWDPETLNADIGVVYLDRKFEGVRPIPLSIRDINHHYIGQKAEIVGFGSTGIDDDGNPIDAYVKRKGKTFYQGAPRIKPLPVNPHPGILKPKIRNQLMQFEGSAPKSNGCFGDSGGPSLMKFHGRSYVVGITTWGDDFCNDFSYHVRVRDFLPFLGKAVFKSHRAD
jgi:hypothetical protein